MTDVAEGLDQHEALRSMARLPVFDRRRSGVLLHLGSLSAGLGRGGRAFIDWLADAGFSVWQMLPTGPIGPDRSPYFGRSDFAGSPVFLDTAELPKTDSSEYAAFLFASRHWLDDYALFEVLSLKCGERGWWTWPVELRNRSRVALSRAKCEYFAEVEYIKRQQFAFFIQWHRLREYAHSRGVRLFGDLPFYVGPNSADTWAHREQFLLDEGGRAIAVSGLPPDGSCPAGQIWHHPLYDWECMQRDRFAHWRCRVQHSLERVDLLRIDHFQALAAHWSVPAGASDISCGHWSPSPGGKLLRALLDEFGELPLAAEDLGLVSEEATELRREFRLPGMRVLQFAYDGAENNPHLPRHHCPDSIVYTGTHDNDTTLGWFLSLRGETRKRIERIVGATPQSIPEALIRQALGSIAALAIVPLQDILGLGSEARLNVPGNVSSNNWCWRLPASAVGSELARHWFTVNRLYGRI